MTPQLKPSADRVLAVLEAHPEGITQMDALLVHGCGDSLAQRVHELRQAGVAVMDSWETTANGARIKRYALRGERRAGQPVGRLRECPACHGLHHVGTTCAWPR